MLFFPKSKEEMITRGLQSIRDNTNVTQLSPGSKTRFLLDAMTEEQFAQHQLFDENIAQEFIRYCEDHFLDYFGDMLNIPRLEATTAQVDVEDENFMFYVDSGNFGDINSGNSFTISAGTVISTLEIEIEQRTTTAINESRPTQERIEYQLVNPVTCASNSSYAFGRIRANIEGSVSDVSRNVLRTHNFDGYTLSTSGRLKCSNKYAIANGRERESEGSYRYRLMNAFKARERANRLAIRLAALSVPGVADVVDFNCEQGPGTFSIYIQATTPTVSPRILRSVQTVVNDVAAYGTRPFVLAPNSLGLEFVLAVNWKKNTIEEEKALGYSHIRENVEDSLNNLGIGEGVDLESLASDIAVSDTNIQGIGLQVSGYFEEVYIYRTSPDKTGVRKAVYTDTKLEPLYNERIILETTTNDRGLIFI